MLLVLIKSIITFILVFFVVRLMGKRQIGEMEPFELVITLIIAEVACIPMNDPYIPFYCGVVPIISLSFLQILISFLSKKFLFVRKLISGRAITVIDKDGINFRNLSKLNMNVNDLMQALRSGGYADVNEILYAVVETNGKMCIIEKEEESEVYLPLSIAVNGKWQKSNVQFTGLDKQSFINLIELNGNELKDIVYADVRQDGLAYVSPKEGKSYTGKVVIKKGDVW